MGDSLSDKLPPYMGQVADLVARLEQRLDALSRLKIVALLPTGQQLSGVVQIVGDSAICQINANGGGSGGDLGGKSVAQPSMALTLCDGTQITVLLANG